MQSHREQQQIRYDKTNDKNSLFWQSIHQFGGKGKKSQANGNYIKFPGI